LGLLWITKLLGLHGHIPGISVRDTVLVQTNVECREYSTRGAYSSMLRTQEICRRLS